MTPRQHILTLRPWLVLLAALLLAAAAQFLVPASAPTRSCMAYQAGPVSCNP